MYFLHIVLFNSLTLFQIRSEIVHHTHWMATEELAMFMLLWQELDRSQGLWGHQAAVLCPVYFSCYLILPQLLVANNPIFPPLLPGVTLAKFFFPALCPSLRLCAGSDSQQPDSSQLPFCTFPCSRKPWSHKHTLGTILFFLSSPFPVCPSILKGYGLSCLALPTHF